MIPEPSAEPKPPKPVKPQSSLKAWRRTMGFNQSEAAAYLEISQAYYYKLEAKTAAARPTIIKRLTERTGVPLDELLGIAY
jgi:transcriptional regulator with XRE-family HTH domain